MISEQVYIDSSYSQEHINHPTVCPLPCSARRTHSCSQIFTPTPDPVRRLHVRHFGVLLRSYIRPSHADVSSLEHLTRNSSRASSLGTMPISMIVATQISICLEDFLFSNFLVLLVLVILVLTRKGSERPAKILIFGLFFTTLCIFSHIFIDFFRVFKAQVMGSPSKSNAYLGNLTNPSFVAKSVILSCQVFIGDSINVWRLFVVSKRKYIHVVLPGLGMLGSLTCGILVAVTSAESSWPIIFDNHFIVPCAALTMYVNIHCTGMIIWHICSRQAYHCVNVPRTIWPAVSVVIESCLLYTTSLVVFIATFITKSNGQMAALDAIVPLVGIIYCLIILQIRYARWTRSDTSRVHTLQIQWPKRAARTPEECSRISGSIGPPLTVQITREVEQHLDSPPPTAKIGRGLESKEVSDKPLCTPSVLALVEVP
ncbi:hypothetical protein DENSPDRAFT_833587 [Dentipellis sp. KUC8613]|nr:hypothetical protein DENSPDRAFT_833587 [Dentipellis sp. KUC8613]